jgi:hypothetical protein
MYDDDYLPYWPREVLPLVPLAYDQGKRMRVARLPGPGCLTYGFRQIQYDPEESGRCATTRVVRAKSADPGRENAAPAGENPVHVASGGRSPQAGH